MKTQLRVKAKSSSIPKGKPLARQRRDAWSSWLATLAAEGVDTTAFLEQDSAVSPLDWLADEARGANPEEPISLTETEPSEVVSEPIQSRLDREVSERSLAPRAEEISASQSLQAERLPVDKQQDEQQEVELEEAEDVEAEGDINDILRQSHSTQLPFKALLESRLGRSLNNVEVYAGTPKINTILSDLGAKAAHYDRKILFAERQPQLETVTHEVVHTLQATPGAASITPEPLPASASAEQEADRLTQDIVSSVRLDSANTPAMPWMPVKVSAAIPPSQIACLRNPPPATVSESPTPRKALTARTEPGSPPQTAPVAPTTTPEPTTSEAQAETESALAGGERTPAGGELEEVPALEVPAPPEPGVSAEDVASREAELAAAEAALANATDVDEKVNAYAAAPPTLKARSYGALGAGMDALAKSESETFQEEMPDFQAKLSGETAAPPDIAVEAPAAEAVSLEAGTPAPAPDPEVTPTAAPGAYTGNSSLLRAVSRFTEGTSSQDRASEIGDTLSDVRTTDPDVETSPGAAPAVPIEGETDPERIEAQVGTGRDRAIQSRDRAQQAVLTGPGPEQVQPLVMAEAIPLEALEQPEITQPAAVEGIDDFSQRELPAEVNTAFDQANQETMQASMAEAQAKVQEATDKRGRDRQEKVDTAQADADQQTGEADADQRREVQSRREDIQTARQQTLNDQSEAVRSLETDAETRRRTDRAAIDDRVQADQATIRSDYAKAERDSEAEVRQGERKAAEKKRKAERDADNESWWDRAVNFVKRAFQALTDAISAVFDAVREAINKILDAVKAAAIALIDRAANFIKNAINEFSAFLQSAVNALLQDRFPELAARLNGLIESAAQRATEAVDAVANRLKEGITALIEGLRAGLNAVLDALQAGLEFATGLIQAALSGDWGAVIRMLLEAVLKVIGIEPETFYSFVGRAAGTFQKIMDDPGAVVSNLLDAVKLGFQKFADGFLNHLKAGIIGWLTGALGGDLQMPTEFNLIGVLDLARQIMGLTLAFIRRIAVRLIGQENVERIEAIIEQVQTLISDGWGGLLEQLKESLNNVQELVIGQIKEFLVTRLILAAITKLASLFNPVGAIVQIVLTLWNVFNFLRENLQRLIQIVQTIVNSISQIVAGVIEVAAGSIETVLANLLPVAISFLANLLGLSGLGRRVSRIIGRLRERFENAIVNFIRGIGRRLSRRRGRQDSRRTADGQSQAAGRPLSVGEKLPIPVSGQETRHLDISVNGQTLTLMVQRPTRSLDSMQQAWTRDVNTLSSDAQKEQAQAALRQLSTKKNSANQAAQAALRSMGQSPSSSRRRPAASRQRSSEQSSGTQRRVVAAQRELISPISQLFTVFGSAAGGSVKDKALAEIRNQIRGKKLTRVAELRTILVSVHRQFRTEGLKSLDIDVANQTAMNIDVLAAASEPERLSVSWEELFGEDDAKAKDIFKVQPRNETNAAISLNGTRIGQVVKSENGRHAEQNLLNQYWSTTLEKARENIQNGERNTISVVINRAPCHNICTPTLVNAMREVDSELKEKTRFILAPTGVYEPVRRLTKEEIDQQTQELRQLAKKLGKPADRVVKDMLAKEVFTEDTTTFNDLRRLVTAGWDLRQLQARDTSTPAGNILAEAAHKLSVETDRIKVGS